MEREKNQWSWNLLPQLVTDICQVTVVCFGTFCLAFQYIHHTHTHTVKSLITCSPVTSLPISWVIELQLMQALFRLWWSSETSPNPWQDCSIGAGKFSYVRLTRRGPLMRCQLPSDRLTPCNVSRQAKNKQTKNHKPIQEMLHKIHAALCRTNYCHSCELLQF